MSAQCPFLTEPDLTNLKHLKHLYLHQSILFLQTYYHFIYVFVIYLIPLE